MRARVIFNHLLTPSHPVKKVFYVRFQTEQVLDYAAGDWLTIAAPNSDALVEAVLQQLSMTGEETVELRRVGSVTSRQALQHHLELTQLNPAVLNKLQRELDWQEWPDRQAMMDFAAKRDVLDFLQAYPSLQGSDVLAFLQPLAPRYYSIASSPNEVGEDCVDLVYRHFEVTQSNRVRQGLVSTCLTQLSPGDTLEINLVKNKNFRLPFQQDPAQNASVLMVGAGTGIAPFIGFLQDWFLEANLAQNQAQNHQAWLFFGETHRDLSYLFETDLSAWQAKGLQLHTAFSRDQKEKYYVQDALWRERQAVWSLLQEGAFLYVCGDKTKLAASVEETVKRIMQQEGGLSEGEASQTWKDWKKAKRIQMDVY